MFITCRVSNALQDAFPGVRILALRAKGLHAVRDTLCQAADIDESVALLRQLATSPEHLADMPIVLQWRNAYRNMGVKPSVFRSSYEALARRGLAGKAMRTGLPVVDYYNAFSVAHRACLGAYDLRKLAADQPIELRWCVPGRDVFAPIGAKPEDFRLVDGLVVYAQGHEVLCWGFNCRDSQKAALDEDTDEAIFFAESTTDEQEACAQNALTAMRASLLALGVDVSAIHFAFTGGPPCVIEPPAPHASPQSLVP